MLLSFASFKFIENFRYVCLLVGPFFFVFYFVVHWQHFILHSVKFCGLFLYRISIFHGISLKCFFLNFNNFLYFVDCFSSSINKYIKSFHPGFNRFGYCNYLFKHFYSRLSLYTFEENRFLALNCLFCFIANVSE
jgi:hypothetical protein